MTHYPCLEAVDKYYLLKETICHVCSTKGVVPCFMPKFAEGTLGNGCHVHISAWKNGANITEAAVFHFFIFQ